MKLAVIANSLCMLRIQHRDEVILDEGRSFYGRALLQLAGRLRNPGQEARPSLILTARLLSLFEVCYVNRAFVPYLCDPLADLRSDFLRPA